MDTLTLITLFVTIIGILSLIYVFYYNAFQKYFIKINEVESKIDSTLRERFDMLSKAADFIKEHTKEEVMVDLSALKNENLSSFELERRLANITREFYNQKMTNRSLIKMASFVDVDFNLRENEAQLDGYTMYYNTCISKFNKLVRMFPSNIVAKMAKLNEKTFYDGKDMYDQNINDFKLY